MPPCSSSQPPRGPESTRTTAHLRVECKCAPAGQNGQTRERNCLQSPCGGCAGAEAPQTCAFATQAHHTVPAFHTVMRGTIFLLAIRPRNWHIDSMVPPHRACNFAGARAHGGERRKFCWKEGKEVQSEMTRRRHTRKASYHRSTARRAEEVEVPQIFGCLTNMEGGDHRAASNLAVEGGAGPAGRPEGDCLETAYGRRQARRMNPPA